MNEVCEYSLVREKTEALSEKAIETGTEKNVRSRLQLLSESLHYESEAFYYAQTLFTIVVENNQELLGCLYQFKNLKNTLLVGLIESKNVYLKEKFAAWLLYFMTKFHKSDISQKPHQFLIPLLLQKPLYQALHKEENSLVFIQLILDILNTLNIGDISKESLKVEHLLSKMTDFIINRSKIEKNTQENEAVLVGILQILRHFFIEYDNNKVRYYAQKRGLVKKLLHNCIFGIQDDKFQKTDLPSKYKSSNSRIAAFQLLLTLARQCNESLQDIIEFITSLHTKAHWRTKRTKDWIIVQKKNVKSNEQHTGLKNLGSISYINSQLQQLYMIPAFRRAVMDVEDLRYHATPKEENMLYQLKCLFSGLSHSEKQYFNLKGFCHAFKNKDGSPLNVFRELDSEEFLNQFMNCLDNLTKGAKAHRFIKETIGGVKLNELTADNEGMPLYRGQEESFLTIGLQVKQTRTLEQALTTLIEGEVLEGENAYLWEEVGKRCTTRKQSCFKQLSDHLIFVLKRFELDDNTMQRQKVNNYFEFPNKINLEPYSQQGLRKVKQVQQKKESKLAKGAQEAGQANKIETDEFPTEYFDFKLTGIVIHEGNAHSGHYYSLIQNREADSSNAEDKRWIEFNDEIVRPYDPKEIPTDAFGEDEKY